MKGKAKISNAVFDESKSINALAFHKVVDGIRKQSRNKSNSIGQESVDFETAISRAGCGKFNYFLLLVAIPASCSSGYVTGAVSLILPVAGCDLNLSSFQKGLLNSAPYFGMVLSAFFWGFLSDAFGRKKLLVFGFLLDTVMSTGSSLAPNLLFMGLFKFFSGIMICGPYSIFMAYMSEVFMDKRRDMAVLSAGIFSAIGNIFQPFLAMIIMPLDINVQLFWGLEITPWRAFLLACSAPSLICGISSYFFVESPKFLWERGRNEEALNAFQKIYTINTGLPQCTYPVNKLHDVRRPSAIKKSAEEDDKSFFTLLKDGVGQALILLKPPFVKRALFLFFIQFGSMASLNVLRLWLPQMFTLVEMQNGQNSTEQGICQVLMTNSDKPEADCEDLVMKPEVFINMVWVNAGTLIAHIIFIISVNFVSKKAIITTTTIFAASCVIMIPLVSTQFVVVFASIFIAVLNVTFFTTIGLVVSIFPTKIRATSVSLTMMCGRIGVLLANIGIASIMYTNCNLLFYILCGVLMVMGLSAIFLSATPITDDRRSQNNGSSKTT